MARERSLESRSLTGDADSQVASLEGSVPRLAHLLQHVQLLVDRLVRPPDRQVRKAARGLVRGEDAGQDSGCMRVLHGCDRLRVEPGWFQAPALGRRQQVVEGPGPP